MSQGIFDSTTIPILEQVVNFSQARHTVLAGNIANIDTPGYQPRDLSVGEFQQRLSEAIEARREPPTYRSPGEPDADRRSTTLAEVSKSRDSILYHDESRKTMEFQVSEMVKNQMQHNLALAVMVSQFQLMQVAISERV
jgi:flagellar basal-body rod protein FlgB